MAAEFCFCLPYENFMFLLQSPMLGFSPLTVQSPDRLVCITMWDLTMEQAGKVPGACETAVPEDSLPVIRELHLSGSRRVKS